MPYRLDAVVSAVALEAGLDPDRVAQDKTNIYRFINDTRYEIAELPIEFPALEYNFEVVGTAFVTAGTINATQNQAEVTGTSTAFTTAMADRYLQVGSNAVWQRISFVTDTTHLTLESSYNASTVTSSTYKIWKKLYALPGKVEKLFSIKEQSSTIDLAYYHPREFKLKFRFDDQISVPQAYTMFSNTDFGMDYLGSTVFTVTCTANSPIMDFASGAGLATAMLPGDRLYIGTTAYYVDRILTDTKLSVRNFFTVSSAGINCTALGFDRRYVQFYPAIDGTPLLLCQAKKKVYDLVGDGDWIEEGWYEAVKKGAIAKAMGYTNNPKEQQKLSEYGQAIAMLIRNQFKALNPNPRLTPYIRRRYGPSGFKGFGFGVDRDI